MIPTAEALAHIFDLVSPLASEVVPLRNAAGRVMVESAMAGRSQPPFRAAAMDGYAVRANDAKEGTRLEVVGEAAAGHGFSGIVEEGQAVRIFTGAPVPNGADRVVIQEDVSVDGDRITLSDTLDSAMHVRALGTDFEQGFTLKAPRRLSPSDVALLAAMNVPQVLASRRPEIAIIATGDELVMPGEDPGDDQIIASNTFGLAAMIEAAGGTARLLPIARDNRGALEQVFDLATSADMIVTIGGASVGDHDLVADVAADLGMERAFYKIAMRPGKPLMAGRLSGKPMLGLPGNPVSAMVCGTIFVLPALRVMLGLPAAPARRVKLRLSHDVGENGPREHYMRARSDGEEVRIFDRQDSSLLTVLSDANALAVRPPNDPARDAGDTVDVIRLDGRD